MVAEEKDYDSFWENCEYPRIGISAKGLTIRFTAYGHGEIIGVKAPNPAGVGYHSRSWIMSGMSPDERRVEW